jgi:capsular exopolysaccharide synthesis family protein
MSLIFEALQKCECERRGVELSTVLTATELLQLAERHSISDREGALQAEGLGITENTEASGSFLLPAGPRLVRAIEGSIADESSADNQESEAFSQFQPLQISIPPQSRLVCLTESDSLVAEKFRYLGASLQQARRSRPLKKILITSAVPQEGKTMVAANLACSLARATGQRTLLLDGDLRRPSIAKTLGLGDIPGVCEWLQDKCSLMKSIYHINNHGFWVMPAGGIPGIPLELLQLGKLSPLMDQLAKWFDWIIIDSPPALTLADTIVWMRLADGILLIVRKGVSGKRQLQKSLETIEQKKLIGALLNCSSRSAENEYYYHYQPSVAS